MVDTNEVMHRFDLLENKIESLIEHCKALENDNFELKQKVAQLEAVVAEKTESENQYSKQKELIRSKIDNLLEKINHAPGNTEGG